ncbi:hypothetical protein MtrunA17_Chr8g0391001 [Medicago truncatula]|uniref:Uncharacterized protein n=1 Tax=Medicago truncatula TaxID=3880 RepID=A0A396GY20_MEDTR|nr:hypothetical protein MtrunA17_Chr8g0391001 [Medicago truncatula]
MLCFLKSIPGYIRSIYSFTSGQIYQMKITMHSRTRLEILSTNMN